MKLQVLVMLAVTFGLTSVGAQEHVPPQSQLVGCVIRDANGALLLNQVPSSAGKTYLLSGSLPMLQRQVHKLVSTSGSITKAGKRDAFRVDHLEVLSDSCASVLPSKNPIAVEGKTGETVKATPVTSTGATLETTPGFQTESDAAENQRETAVQAAADQSGPFRPANPEQAGESEWAADTNAQAASRAEMYPGSTLGVSK